MNHKMVFSVLSFVSVFIYVYIGTFSYKKHKKSRGNRTFLVLCSAYALWSFAYGFAYIAQDIHIFYFWNKLSAFGWCTIGALTLYFVLHITESKFLEHRIFRFVLFLPAVVLLYMALFMFGPDIKTPKHVEDSFYIVDYFYNFSYLLACLIIVYLWGRKSDSARVKKQAGYILAASVFPFIVNFATQNIILKYFGLKFPNISQLYSVATVIGIFYAVHRYKFLHIPEEIILDQVVDEMMDMIMILDIDGKVVRMSEHTMGMLEYDELELIDAKFDMFLDKSCGGKVTIKDMLSSNQYYENITIVKKNGSKIPVNITCKQVYDSHVDDLLGIVVIMQDISLMQELARKNDELQAYVGQLKAAEQSIKQQYEQNLENEHRLRISEKRFRAIFEKAPLGINLSDTVTGKFYETNSKFAEITGRTAEEILSTDWMSITHQDDIAVNIKSEEQLAKSEIQNFIIKKRYVKPDGSIVWAHLTVAGIDFEDSENPCELCLVEDITERVKNEEELKDSEYTFKKLFNDSSDPILLLDGEWIIDCNPATLEILGLHSKEQILGKRNVDLSPEYQPNGENSQKKYQEIIDMLDGGNRGNAGTCADIVSLSDMEFDPDVVHFKVSRNLSTSGTESKSHVKFEWWYKRENGQIFPVEIMFTLILLKGRRVIHAIWRDISERKWMEKKLEYLNYHDQLTGLFNRRFFEEELNRMDVPRNYPLSIVMADVNGLKLMNDSFGHAIGDELLKKVARAIESGCRSDDIVARLGGDEFVMLLPNTDAHETERIIKRIKQIASEEKIGSLPVSFSFGYHVKNDMQTSADEVLKKAEDMMYKNKLHEGPSIRSGTINTMISTLYEKDKREELHSKRVAALCRELGAAISLSDEQIEEIVTAGLLHDIGKIILDESILNNPGKLCEDEWEQLKRHPETGYRILNTVSEMSDLAQYVLSHHERWDGTGYPKGLVGEQIPLLSRIIAISDAYDAMTNGRSYREPPGKTIAIAELQTNAGTQFDPELTRIFINKVIPTLDKL